MKKQIALVALATVISVSCQSIVGYPSFPNSDRYRIGASSTNESIVELNIDWVAGDVEVIYGNDDTFSWSEEFVNGSSNSHTQMRYYVEGTTLNLRFCEPGPWKGNKDLKKRLIVSIPKNYVLHEIEVDQVSGNVAINVEAQKLDIETVSGNATLVNSTERADINAESTSGTIRLQSSGSAAEIDIETVSGKIDVTSLEAARKIEVETVSGDATLHLPSEVSFEAQYRTVSGKFTCDFNCTLHKDVCLFGNNPQTFIYMSSVSGDLKISPNN